MVAQIKLNITPSGACDYICSACKKAIPKYNEQWAQYKEKRYAFCDVCAGHLRARIKEAEQVAIGRYVGEIQKPEDKKNWRWIPSKERLPEPNESLVVVHQPNHTPAVAMFIRHGPNHYFMLTSGVKAGEVIEYWMPLPLLLGIKKK